MRYGAEIRKYTGINILGFVPLGYFLFFGFLSIQPTPEDVGMAADNSGYPWRVICQPPHRNASGLSSYQAFIFNRSHL
jgi:hypothetical protein